MKMKTSRRADMALIRHNPKKSHRFEDEWPKNVNNKDRVKLEKDSSSLNVSFVMTREELIRKEKYDLWSKGNYEEEGEKMPGQSYSEFIIFSMSGKKQRSGGSPKVANVSVFVSPCKEVVNGAICLLMLSRDTNSICDSTEKISLTIGSGNNVHSFPSEGEDQQFKKPKVSSLSTSVDHGDINPDVLKNGKITLSNQHDTESGMQSSCNQRRYVCPICYKSFHSYQALGGHRTSHNKIADYKNLTNQKHDSQTVRKSRKNCGNHLCTFCGKHFSTQQALGGHKRSHFVAANNSVAAVVVVVSPADTNGVHPHPAPMEIEQKFSILDSTDLNLPATDNDS